MCTTPKASLTPDQISFFPIYKGINALCWPSHINYHLVPPHTDSVPPSTNHYCPIPTHHTDSSHSNAQLSQLVFTSFFGSIWGREWLDCPQSSSRAGRCVKGWTLWDHSRQNLIFYSKSLWPKSTLSFWGKKSSFVWNDPKESKWAQNGPKWSKTCYIDHLGSFWTLLDHFWKSVSLPCTAIFGPKRAISGPPAHMIEGWQWPKLLQTNFVYG